MTFDGTHISVFDLKREIVLANKMGNGKDFDIKVYDNVNGEGESNLLLNLDVGCHVLTQPDPLQSSKMTITKSPDPHPSSLAVSPPLPKVEARRRITLSGRPLENP